MVFVPWAECGRVELAEMDDQLIRKVLSTDLVH